MKANTGTSIQWEKYDGCPTCGVHRGKVCEDVRNGRPLDRPHKTRRWGTEPVVCARQHPMTFQGIRTFCVVSAHHKSVHRDGKGRTWVDMTSRV